MAIRGARALIGASAASEIGNWLYNAALLGYVYSATCAELTLSGKNLRHARRRAAQVLRDSPRVLPA